MYLGFVMCRIVGHSRTSSSISAHDIARLLLCQISSSEAQLLTETLLSVCVYLHSQVDQSQTQSGFAIALPLLLGYGPRDAALCVY